jgi:hypothetical protein
MSEEIIVNCLSCNGEILSTLDQLGVIVDCPHCKTATLIESNEHPVFGATEASVEPSHREPENQPQPPKRQNSNTAVWMNPYSKKPIGAVFCFNSASFLLAGTVIAFFESNLAAAWFSMLFMLIFGLYFAAIVITFATSCRWLLAETLQEIKKLNVGK